MTKTNKFNEEYIDYGGHKQGRVPKEITKLSKVTREKYGIEIPEPTMFDGMGEVEN